MKESVDVACWDVDVFLESVQQVKQPFRLFSDYFPYSLNAFFLKQDASNCFPLLSMDIVLTHAGSTFLVVMQKLGITSLVQFFSRVNRIRKYRFSSSSDVGISLFLLLIKAVSIDVAFSFQNGERGGYFSRIKFAFLKTYLRIKIMKICQSLFKLGFCTFPPQSSYTTA